MDVSQAEAPEAPGETPHWMPGRKSAVGRDGKDFLSEEGTLRGCWPFLRKAARFILKEGPGTDRDRWERTAGFSPYTLACEIAAGNRGAGELDLFPI